MMQLPILPAPTTANLVYPDMSWHYPLCVCVWGGLGQSVICSPGSFCPVSYLFYFPNPSQGGSIICLFLSRGRHYSRRIAASTELVRQVTLQLTEQIFLS